MDCTCKSDTWIPCESCINAPKSVFAEMTLQNALLQDYRALEPRPGDRMQSQATNPDIDSWESEGGHSGLRAVERPGKPEKDDA